MSLDKDIDLDVNGTTRCPIRRQTRVFYVNVGTTAPIRSHTLVEEFKEAMIAAGLDSFYYENFFVGIREGDTRIEVFP